jgi:hypothetical protein
MFDPSTAPAIIRDHRPARYFNNSSTFIFQVLKTEYMHFFSMGRFGDHFYDSRVGLGGFMAYLSSRHRIAMLSIHIRSLFGDRRPTRGTATKHTRLEVTHENQEAHRDGRSVRGKQLSSPGHGR